MFFAAMKTPMTLRHFSTTFACSNLNILLTHFAYIIQIFTLIGMKNGDFVDSRAFCIFLIFIIIEYLSVSWSFVRFCSSAYAFQCNLSCDLALAQSLQRHYPSVCFASLLFVVIKLSICGVACASRIEFGWMASLTTITPTGCYSSRLPASAEEHCWPTWPPSKYLPAGYGSICRCLPSGKSLRLQQFVRWIHRWIRVQGCRLSRMSVSACFCVQIQWYSKTHTHFVRQNNIQWSSTSEKYTVHRHRNSVYVSLPILSDDPHLSGDERIQW